MYSAIKGDTFAKVSRKLYGDESWESRIRSANPQASEPLAAGVLLTIPPSPRDEDSNSGEGVALKVDGKSMEFWDTVIVTRNLDSADTATFTAPFDPDIRAHRDIFRPMQFRKVSVFVDSTRIFRGTLVAATPQSDGRSSNVSASCYSLPGVLSDCSAPIRTSGQFFNQTITGIAEKLCGPFSISTVAEVDVGAAFSDVSVRAGGRVMQFLATLAQQRGLVLGSNSDGALVIRSPNGTKQVAEFTEGVSPLISCDPSLDPQQFYSHITALQPASTGEDGGGYTTTNPHAAGVRPLAFTAPDTETGTLKTASAAKLSRMFASAVSYTITLTTWRDKLGELWAPGDIVTLTAPSAMIYKPTKFMIRSAALTATPDGETATLSLILPGTLSGAIPEAMPWDE